MVYGTVKDLNYFNVTVNGRDGRHLLPIVKFFFDSGFDLTKKYNTGLREASYINNIFDNIKYSFSGPSSMETLDYILGYVTVPDQLCDSDGVSIKDEFKFAALFEQTEYELTYYAAYLLKASEMIDSFVKERNWEL